MTTNKTEHWFAKAWLWTFTSIAMLLYEACRERLSGESVAVRWVYPLMASGAAWALTFYREDNNPGNESALVLSWFSPVTAATIVATLVAVLVFALWRVIAGLLLERSEHE